MNFLTEKFLNKYPDHPSHMSNLGLFTYYRTYARFLPDKGRRETWKEMVARAVDYNVSLELRHRAKMKLPMKFDTMKEEAEELFDNVFNLRQFLSGRTFWIGGTEVSEKYPMANFNCSFTNIESWEDLGELFYLLMLGSGVGFKCTPEMAKKIPSVRKDTALLISPYEPVPKHLRLEKTSTKILDNGFAKIYVGDSKEGWRDAFIEYMTLLSNKEYENVHTIKVSFNSVRPQGERLKQFGGTASGPQPLMDMFVGIDNVIKNKVDPSLKPLERDHGAYYHVRPIHVLDIGNMIGSNVVSGGVRRCLPEGTLVHTVKGLKKIEDVKIGDEVITARGQNVVTDWVEQGVQEVLEIHHQNGTFKCTPKHKMAVMTAPDMYEWKLAKDLVPGDKLVFVEHEIDSEGIPMPDNGEFTFETIDTDLAWLIGYIQGNGYVDMKNGKLTISCPTNLENMANKVKDLMEKYCNRTPSQKPVNGNYVVYEIGNAPLVRYLHQYVKQANTSINVPDFILQGSISVKEGYLAGLFDADGTAKNRPVLAVTSIYPDFLRQVQAVYSSIGIMTRMRMHREEAGTWKALYQLIVVGERPKKKFIDMMKRHGTKLNTDDILSKRSGWSCGYPAEWIDKTLPYNNKWSPSSKQMTVETYERVTNTSQTLIPVEVREIVYNGEHVQTYDISVDEVHEFVAEGILTHNTAEIFLFDPSDYECMFAKYGINGLWSDEHFAKHESVIQQMKSMNLTIPEWFYKLGEKQYDDKVNGGNPYNFGRTNIGHRRLSNNSIAFSKRPSEDMLHLVFLMIQLDGEPGFVNVEAGSYRRDNMHGVNPCFRGDMRLLTTAGYKRFDELDGRKVNIINPVGEVSYGEVWCSGEKEIWEVRLDNCKSIFTTNDHRFMTNTGGVVKAKDLLGYRLMPYSEKSSDIDNAPLVIAVKSTNEYAKVYDFNEPLTHWGVVEGVVAHNCGEILLDSKEQCNLTTINLVRFKEEGELTCVDYDGETYDVPSEKLARAQELSARAGIRMTLIDLELTEWDSNQKRDRLIGCSLTGFHDAVADVKRPDDFLGYLKYIAREFADQYASELRIPTPLLTTTVKPEGTLSLVAGGVSAGIHFSHAPYYIRRIRVSSDDALAKAAKFFGWPIHAEVGTPDNDVEQARTLVIDFPVKSNSDRTKDDVGALEQLQWYLTFQQNYTEHNASNTITVKPGEWEDLEKAIYQEDVWNSFVGVSFLSHDGGTYKLAPYEAITEEEYAELAASFKRFDPMVLEAFESIGVSDLDSDPSCGSGGCPVR